jgi:oxygen-independent coproporphyrinogen-3 oxidase
MINALRLRKGFTVKQFSLHTGLAKDTISQGIDEAVKKGLLIQQGDNIQPTEKGFCFLSEIQLMFS